MDKDIKKLLENMKICNEISCDELDYLSFEFVYKRLFEISNLLLSKFEYDRNRGFYYLSCLVNEMHDLINDDDEEEQENE